jgi:RNA polymerase sigma-70 factor (ECF subfamily)
VGPDELTDAELLVGADPDGAAFRAFYDRHAAAVLSWCYRRTHDAELAADVTMETFAAALVARHRFRPTQESARPWLYGIARNLLGTFIRKQAVSSRHRERLGVATSVQLDDHDIERVEQLVDVGPTRRAIRAALERLPRGEADAVWLRVGLELPYVDVAARLGCTVGAARVRVTRGLSRLADILEDQ